MITATDKRKIRGLAKKYDASRIVLFGSSVTSAEAARDIDLAVSGVVPEKFFAFFGDLMFRLSKPVDLIDLDHDNHFSRMVSREGTLIYAKS